MSMVFGPPLISTKARTTDRESPDQHHCDFCRLPVELRVSILGHANSCEDLMALRSACACMYTASNGAESALTYEFLTRNYLSCTPDVARLAYAHHSFMTEAKDCQDPYKLLQIYRGYMKFGVSDLRKNKKFADIMDIQSFHMKILELASKYIVENISIVASFNYCSLDTPNLVTKCATSRSESRIGFWTFTVCHYVQ